MFVIRYEKTNGRLINESAMENDAHGHVHSDTWKFYLERVGFEEKINTRITLNNGENLVGRSGVPGVDIEINSDYCSRKHCVITARNNTLIVKDLDSINGTFCNGVKEGGMGTTLTLGDLISIVGHTKGLAMLIGNPNFYVYRISRYSRRNPEVYEIDDDEPITVSDDEDFNSSKRRRVDVEKIDEPDADRRGKRLCYGLDKMSKGNSKG